MKKTALLAMLLSACLVACGGSSDAKAGDSTDSGSSTAGGGSQEWVTDSAELPSDEKGLAKVYGDLMTEVVETMEGIDTKEELNAGLEKVASMAPAFSALMKRSEELDRPVDEGGISAELDDLTSRMDAAMKSVLQKFPQDAMRVMNAFSDMTGGIGQR